MRRALLCAALAAAWLPSSAGAQSLMLTESQALARFSTDSARVRAARAGIEVAQADVLSARRWPNPRVSLERQAVAGVTEAGVWNHNALIVATQRRMIAAAEKTVFAIDASKFGRKALALTTAFDPRLTVVTNRAPAPSVAAQDLPASWREDSRLPLYLSTCRSSLSTSRSRAA